MGRCEAHLPARPRERRLVASVRAACASRHGARVLRDYWIVRADDVGGEARVEGGGDADGGLAMQRHGQWRSVVAGGMMLLRAAVT